MASYSLVYQCICYLLRFVHGKILEDMTDQCPTLCKGRSLSVLLGSLTKKQRTGDQNKAFVTPISSPHTAAQ